ncbi:LppU/SCO3897 family protein [Allorhizocola rhizosphaerae]|uniref:LppU/SCO3897 family protein n=1 Tax=Allorhizocola rhizosphaerae TaxID=1872709 RepID=UPI000E3D166F|nr:hypothetical protein [Allorhizocola rhizosphaerae]
MKLRIGVEIALVVVGVLVVGAVAAYLKFGFVEGETAKPAVGSCVGPNPEAETMKLVDCAAPGAAHKVVGVVEGKTRAEVNQVCQEFGAADSFLFLWEGADTPATRGQVLCLAKIPKS